MHYFRTAAAAPAPASVDIDATATADGGAAAALLVERGKPVVGATVRQCVCLVVARFGAVVLGRGRDPEIDACQLSIFGWGWKCDSIQTLVTFKRTLNMLSCTN